MTDILSLLKSLHRPRLLVRAARVGLVDYRREKHLRRFHQVGPLPSPQKAIMMLLNTEAELEDRRQEGDGSYSPARHIEVLVALMGEARMI